MMAEIVQAILDNCKSNGLEVREIGFKDLIDGTINLTRPAVNVTINQSSVSQVSLYTYKFVLTVSMIIVFQNLKAGYEGEARRKEGVYKLIEAISNNLTLQNLGLELENPLIPQSFRNITTSEFAKNGYQLYNLNFWCSYNVDWKNNYGDQGNLTSILNQYWLMPNDSTSMDSTHLRGSDLITTV